MYADKFEWKWIPQEKTEKVAGSATHVALRDLYLKKERLSYVFIWSAYRKKSLLELSKPARSPRTSTQTYCPIVISYTTSGGRDELVE